MRELLSVIVPCYNEGAVIERTAKAIVDTCTGRAFDFEIIFVNDGSKDDTLAFLKKLAGRSEKIKYISFSRNFGKEAAMLSGLARLPDKMHLHYIHPNITYRYLWSEGNQGAFLSFGIGYMNYQERTYQRGERNGISFQRGYCGLSFGMGYEFYITKKLSGVFRADILTADWFANPDARLSNPYDYDDGIDHSWFKNNVTFFNLGFAIQFGR